jgi:hypothetical protein
VSKDFMGRFEKVTHSAKWDIIENQECASKKPVMPILTTPVTPALY